MQGTIRIDESRKKIKKRRLKELELFASCRGSGQKREDISTRGNEVLAETEWKEKVFFIKGRGWTFDRHLPLRRGGPSQ